MPTRTLALLRAAPPAAAVEPVDGRGDGSGAAERRGGTALRNDGPAPTKAKAPKRPRRDGVQLFKFDAPAPSFATHPGNAINVNSRPRRRPKAVLRYDALRYDSHHRTAKKCKTGHGFDCPRCAAAMSYDARVCGGCGLECYYEAGVGPVVLRERRGPAAGAGRRETAATREAAVGIAARRAGEEAATTWEGAAAGPGGEGAVAAGGGTADRTTDSHASLGGQAAGGNGAANAGEVAGAADAKGGAAEGASMDEGAAGDALEDMRGQLADAQRAEAELTQRAAELRSKCAALSNERDGCMQREKEARASHEKVRGRAADLDSKLATESSARGELERRLEARTAQLAEANTEAAEKSSEAETLRAELEALRADRDAARMLASEREKSMQALKLERDELAKGLEGANAKLVAEDEERRNGAKSAAAMANEANEAQASETGHETIVVRQRGEIESLRRQLADASSKITSLSADKTALVARIAMALDDDVATLLKEKDKALDEATNSLEAMQRQNGAVAGGAPHESGGEGPTRGRKRKVSLGDADASDDASVSSTTTHSDLSGDRVKSALKRTDASIVSLPSCLSGGRGKVTFDSKTVFDRSADRAPFDLFSSSSSVHSGKENNWSGRKRAPTKLPHRDSGVNEDAGGAKPLSPSKRGASGAGRRSGGIKRKQSRSIDPMEFEADVQGFL